MGHDDNQCALALTVFTWQSSSQFNPACILGYFCEAKWGGFEEESVYFTTGICKQ